MVRPIMKDVLFLGMKSSKAGPEDAAAARDLLDTLAAHEADCVGMAANMIGIRKNIIAFREGKELRLMYNPEITKRLSPFMTEEGCLSLDGTRKVRRFKSIRVSYEDSEFRRQTAEYSGWTAQIIQHEIDHLSGIII